MHRCEGQDGCSKIMRSLNDLMNGSCHGKINVRSATILFQCGVNSPCDIPVTPGFFLVSSGNFQPSSSLVKSPSQFTLIPGCSNLTWHIDCEWGIRYKCLNRYIARTHVWSRDIWWSSVLIVTPRSTMLLEIAKGIILFLHNTRRKFHNVSAHPNLWTGDCRPSETK